MAEESLTIEQRNAVDARDRDTIVSAGAGTGKTKVLVRVYVESLVDHIREDRDASHLDGIVAFTFTERAAQELRHRIRVEIGVEARALAKEDPEASRLLARYVRETEGARISTIHGFCRRLLAAHPVAAGLDPRFKVLDESGEARLKALAWQRSRDQLLDPSNAESRARMIDLLASNDETGLSSKVSSAFDQTRVLPEGGHWPDLPVPDPDALEPALDALKDAATNLVASASDLHGNTKNAIEKRCHYASDLKPTLNIAELDPGDLILSDGAYSLTSREKGGVDYESALDGWDDALDEILRLRSIEQQALAADSYECFRELLDAFGRHYEELKDSRSVLDFEELQTRTIALLEGSEKLAGEIRSGIRHVMVDEFQDTNWLQYRLIELLTKDGAKRFEVGDSLQSIYGFRNAEIEIFERDVRDFDSGPDTEYMSLPLRGNFRSTPSLIAGFNAMGRGLIESLASKADGDTDSVSYSDLTVGREPDGPDVGVEFLLTSHKKSEWEDPEPDPGPEKDGSPNEPIGLEMPSEGNASPAVVAESKLLARRLVQLVRDEGVDRSEIVVLLRAFRNRVGTYEQALRAAGLNPFVVGGHEFWSSQEVRDCLCLLEVLANPLDEKQLIGALASPACSVSPGTLWILRRAAGSGGNAFPLKVVLDALVSDDPTARLTTSSQVTKEGQSSDENRDHSPEPEALEEIPTDEKERLTVFWNRMRDLRSKVGRAGLADLVEQTVTATGYDLAVLMRDDGSARWANLRKLFRMARDLEVTDGLDLRGLLFFATSETRREREAPATIVPEHHDGVRIMTAHSAKGLQFPTVAVANLGRELPSDAVGPFAKHAPDGVRYGVRLTSAELGSVDFLDYSELAEAKLLKEREEELRIAHVSFTRAEKRLVLSGAANLRQCVSTDAEMRPTSSIATRLVGLLPELEATAGESGVTEAVLFGPPAPREGLDLTFETQPSRIEWVIPAPGEGKRLEVEPLESKVPEDDEIVLPPPSLPEAPPAAASDLSFTSLSLYRDCGLRFLAEYEIGMRGESDDATYLGSAEDELGSGDGAGPTDSEPLNRGESRILRFGPGNAVHSLLEWSARNRWQAPTERRVRSALGSEGLDATPEAIASATKLVENWLGSDLLAALRDRGAAFVPEESFLLPIGVSMFRGFIDLSVADTNGDTIEIVDYKTNKLAGTNTSRLMDYYDLQRKLYAVAVGERATTVISHYVFLEDPSQVEELAFSQEDLAEARSEIGQLASGIADGRFSPSLHPGASLCHDCPVWRSCPHTPEDKKRFDSKTEIEPDPSRLSGSEA